MSYEENELWPVCTLAVLKSFPVNAPVPLELKSSLHPIGWLFITRVVRALTAEGQANVFETMVPPPEMFTAPPLMRVCPSPARPSVRLFETRVGLADAGRVRKCTEKRIVANEASSLRKWVS
jgi:hypothetical protein